MKAALIVLSSAVGGAGLALLVLAVWFQRAMWHARTAAY